VKNNVIILAKFDLDCAMGCAATKARADDEPFTVTLGMPPARQGQDAAVCMAAAEVVPDIAPAASVAKQLPMSEASRFTDLELGALATLVWPADDAPIRLLAAGYLVALWQNGGRLTRRQDVPDSGFYHMKLTSNTRLVAVSYPWLAPDEPDADGHHLRQLGPVLHAFMRKLGGNVAVFIDFSCLFQAPRTPDQSLLFKRGLAGINIIYAHQWSWVLCLTTIPKGVDARAYHSRGWCVFELLVASMITNSNLLLDLGRLAGAASLADYDRDVRLKCIARRKAPVSPARFEQMLLHTRDPSGDGHKYKFTNGKEDRPFVIARYAEVFDAAVGGATHLHYTTLNWGDPEAHQLGAALPFAISLKVLSLKENPQVGDRGAAAIAHHLPATLVELDLRATTIGDSGFAAVLLGVPQSIESINMIGTPLTDAGLASLHATTSSWKKPGGCLRLPFYDCPGVAWRSVKTTFAGDGPNAVNNYRDLGSYLKEHAIQPVEPSQPDWSMLDM
jgi:hypothetical protein